MKKLLNTNESSCERLCGLMLLDVKHDVASCGSVSLARVSKRILLLLSGEDWIVRSSYFSLGFTMG